MKTIQEALAVKPQHKGEIVEIGIYKALCPPLLVGQCREFYTSVKEAEKLAKDGADLGDVMDKIIPVLVVALKRNYPDIEREHLEANCDLVQYRMLRAAVLGTTGYRLATEGELQPATVQ